MKKGFTLIELMVSMGIFTVIMTLAVGAYVSVTRMKTMASVMRESQEETRIASETITRSAKEASGATVGGVGSSILQLHYVPSNKCISYQIKPNSGIDETDYSNSDCTGTGQTQPLISGNTVKLQAGSWFHIDYTTSPPVLNISLSGTINGLLVTTNPYYSDAFTLTPSVVLENIQ